MPADATKPTPMMQRYLEVKRQHPGSLLLFRMGDFYELFYEDAEIAARAVGLTLTSRDKNSPQPIPMAGFPHHQLENYLQKLIRAGFRAAICDQVEDPKKAKGLVKREVTRIVTPGTLTDEALLDPRQNNYLACLLPGRDQAGLAWLELSEGKFFTCDVPISHLADELSRIAPAECLLPEGDFGDETVPAWQLLLEQSGTVITPRPLWCFTADESLRILREHFATATLEGFGLEEQSAGVIAAGALLDYVRETQKSSLEHIRRLLPYQPGHVLQIDESTRRSLELTQTLREGRREGSLLWVLDETVTPMGARLLAEWLSAPRNEAAEINRRLDAVEELTAETALRRDLREQLQSSYDVQRLVGRIATGRATPRDLAALAATLALLPKIKAKLAGRRSALLQQLEAELDLCPEIRADIEAALVDDPPVNITEGGVIRGGFHARLDELRELARGGKEWIARYQAREIERTGIPNLKVGFNKVFGYYLEVTAAHADKVPPDYHRKQTLKNQERYITPELKEYEEKVLHAEEQALALEQELFGALRERVKGDCARLQQTAAVLARTDVLSGLAELAVQQNYCRPELTEEPLLDIRAGRHPVLERLQPSGAFVPNNLTMNVPPSSSPASPHPAPDTSRPSSLAFRPSFIHLITGPNMAGKSTYIRQAALMVVMAQMGSFVPAEHARIGLADRIFARVGASDELARGQSTFMVEMTETARILNLATLRSLVILDEIGRGTSTYDGISLAWAVTEYLHDVIGCRTLFATHYHELTELPQSLPGVSNWNVAVREEQGDVIFLHRIVPGGADRSYGIHVAQLAGVPQQVIERARVILQTLETDHLDAEGKTRIPDRPTRPQGARQLSLFDAGPHPLLEKIRELDVEQMTPLAALQELHRLREELRGPSGEASSS